MSGTGVMMRKDTSLSGWCLHGNLIVIANGDMTILSNRQHRCGVATASRALAGRLVFVFFVLFVLIIVMPACAALWMAVGCLTLLRPRTRRCILMLALRCSIGGCSEHTITSRSHESVRNWLQACDNSIDVVRGHRDLATHFQDRFKGLAGDVNRISMLHMVMLTKTLKIQEGVAVVANIARHVC